MTNDAVGWAHAGEGAVTRKRPGDVLAGRYRLDDLMGETGQGRFWRGHDEVLSRAVAIHVIDADDERAGQLMEAARASAQVVEPRLLRVLDIENDGRICYVVNEWGKGTSLDHLVAAEGPLPPRRAAWIVDEVAAALDNAHGHGVAHGRLNPENVLIDTTGSVRLIGFAVEAALYGLGSDRAGIDVVDLAGLLHFGLTGKWPGLSESSVPRAPREQHGMEYRVLRPRQIRAGVPRVLDDLVDEVLNRPHGRHAGPNTAHAIHEVLSGYVGDPAGLSAELADKPQTTVVGQRPKPAPEPDATVAGLPTFDDTTATTSGSSDSPDAAWFTPREDAPAPPPPLESPPERPLFAPEPSDGGPARRARPGAPTPPAGEESSTDSASYWPFDAPPDEAPVPGRRWLRLGLALGGLLVLVIAGIVAAQLGDGDDRAGEETPSSPTASPTPAPAARPISGTAAADFDPFGDPPAENSDLAPRAVDGDPSTTWRTSTYRQNLGPGGIKSGVGIVVDLQTVHHVSEVDLTFARPGTGVSLYVSLTAPTRADQLTEPVATLTAERSRKVAVDPATTGRFVTVWLTSLPRVQGGFRAELAEVSVSGSPS
jgi:serine/threonine protein kinase